MKIIFLKLFIFLIPASIQAQQDGYWDNKRITNKEIIVEARKKIIIQSEDFPVGTTEIVYRITVLNENQEMASSLVSVLKSIPDPTGISQGSAGAVFLLSKVVGDDVANYGIFSLEKYANEYKKTGKTDKACTFQNTPINKAVKLLTVGKSTCLNINTEKIYFGFESKNWVMNQKIILEIVPWVDNKLSRGWNIDNKQIILNQCKLSVPNSKLQNTDEFCVCQLEKLQQKYKFNEYQNLIQVEKETLLKTISTNCMKQTGQNKVLENAKRIEIESLIETQKYDIAINELIEFVKNENPKALDFNNLATCYLLTKQYKKALANAKKASLLDESELLVQLTLAHIFMFSNDLKASKNIHKLYKNQNINNHKSWKEKTILDFELFKKIGLPNDDFDKITRLLD